MEIFFSYGHVKLFCRSQSFIILERSKSGCTIMISTFKDKFSHWFFLKNLGKIYFKNIKNVLNLYFIIINIVFNH